MSGGPGARWCKGRITKGCVNGCVVKAEEATGPRMFQIAWMVFFHDFYDGDFFCRFCFGSWLIPHGRGNALDLLSSHYGR